MNQDREATWLISFILNNSEPVWKQGRGRTWQPFKSICRGALRRCHSGLVDCHPSLVSVCWDKWQGGKLNHQTLLIWLLKMSHNLCFHFGHVKNNGRENGICWQNLTYTQYFCKNSLLWSTLSPSYKFLTTRCWEFDPFLLIKLGWPETSLVCKNLSSYSHILISGPYLAVILVAPICDCKLSSSSLNLRDIALLYLHYFPSFLMMLSYEAHWSLPLQSNPTTWCWSPVGWCSSVCKSLFFFQI